MNFTDNCLMCNSKDVDDEECILNIQGMGYTAFCPNCFNSSLNHLTITPPMRYFLAIPLSKKSKAERMIMDTNHIEEFKQWCVKNTTGDTPYRFGIYCNKVFPEKEQKEWLSKPHGSDHMEMCDDDDYEEGKDIVYFWPRQSVEDYMNIIKIYQTWEPNWDGFNIWTYKEANVTIKPTLWTECLAEMNAEIEILQDAKKRILELQKETNNNNKKAKTI